MKQKLFGMGLAGLFTALSMSANASDVASDVASDGFTYADFDSWSKIITFSAGPAWYENRGNLQSNFVPSLVFPPGYFHTYFPAETSGVVGTGEVFFGLATRINPQLSGQLGIAGAYSGDGKSAGTLIVGTNPTIYTYSYQLTNARIAMKGKLVAEMPWRVKPYISASAGVGFNTSSNYQTSHSFFGNLSQPAFMNDTELSFSYTAGIGLQATICPHWQAGIGYEFSDWGKSSLNQASLLLPNVPPIVAAATYPGLTAGHFLTNELQFSLSYII